MRFTLTLWAATVLVAMPTMAQQIVSEYTDLDHEQHCAVFAGGDPAEGNWSNLVCQGWRGYPVLIRYSDARESLFYGVPPGGDLTPSWESFTGFNEVGPKIEWRIEQDGPLVTPFATIHRWFVDAGDDSQPVEVLVIERVGQLHSREGCAVGYVVATGNPEANQKARLIADSKARSHVCGNPPEIDVGSVPLPGYIRMENEFIDMEN